MRDFDPRPWQLPMVDFGLKHKRCALLARMGMGKTAATLSIFDARMFSGEVRKGAVLAPLRVARSTWPEEAPKWRQFSDCRIGFVKWTPAERTFLAELRKAEVLEERRSPDAKAQRARAEGARGAAQRARLAVIRELDIQTVNYDIVPQVVEILGDAWPFEMVVADECFAPGTLISTQQGSKPIQSLRVGDAVLTAIGPRKVTHVYRKTAQALVRLHLSNGREVVCTPTHLFRAEGRWIESEHLAGHIVVCDSKVQALWSILRHKGVKGQKPEAGPVLQPPLWGESLGFNDAEDLVSAASSQDDSPLGGGKRSVERGDTDTRDNEGKVVCGDETERRPIHTTDTRGKRKGDERMRAHPQPGSCPGLGVESSGHHEAASEGGVGEPSVELQTRFRVAGTNDVLGSRRREPQHGARQAAGCAEDSRDGSVRVDRVENIECGSPVEVWDIEVEEAHHYFAEGCLVHNCTRVKSFRLRQGGKRAQTLSRVAHGLTLYWLNLTGTVAPNGLADLWGPMWFVDQGLRLGRSYDDFESRWFGFQRAKDAVNAHQTRIKRVVFPHAFDEIIGRIKDVALAFNPKDWFNIKSPVVVPVYVELPPDARKKYREMERDLFTQVAGHDIEAFAASAKMIKCLQLANGAVYTGSDEEVETDISHWVEAHDEKLQALESIIEEAGGEPVLVAYHFKPDLARLKKRFPQGRHINTKKDEDDFKAGLIPVAFVHPQSIGHGVDGFQHVCHIIVFFAVYWDLETHDQIIERIGPMRQEQAGFDREVMVYQILARGTQDEVVAARLVEKRHVQDATMDSLAYKPEDLAYG